MEIHSVFIGGNVIVLVSQDFQNYPYYNCNNNLKWKLDLCINLELQESLYTPVLKKNNKVSGLMDHDFYTYCRPLMKPCNGDIRTNGVKLTVYKYSSICVQLTFKVSAKSTQWWEEWFNHVMLEWLYFCMQKNDVIIVLHSSGLSTESRCDIRSIRKGGSVWGEINWESPNFIYLFFSHQILKQIIRYQLLNNW